MSPAAGEESVAKNVVQRDHDVASTQWANTVRELSTVGGNGIAPMAGIEPAMGA
ncbi:MAG: hypothetical protein ACLQPH_09650 [Acidimicrobiales bacterium]